LVEVLIGGIIERYDCTIISEFYLFLLKGSERAKKPTQKGKARIEIVIRI
jgi:hypothetical protein